MYSMWGIDDNDLAVTKIIGLNYLAYRSTPIPWSSLFQIKVKAVNLTESSHKSAN